MVRGPRETAHHVLGVEIAAVRGGHIDCGDAQHRIHPVGAVPVVLGGNRPGHGRTVRGRRAPPRRRVGAGNAVKRAGHGLVGIHLARQVGDSVVHPLVEDANRHIPTHDIHALSLQSPQRLQVPPVPRLRVGLPPSVRLVARGRRGVLNRGHPQRARTARRSGHRLVRSHARLVIERNHGLVAADRHLASRADRVKPDPLAGQGLAQIEGERRGRRLHEERPKLGVLAQRQALQVRGPGESPLEGRVIRALRQVDRIVGGQLSARALR